jgi:hypothetical protein
VVAVSITMPIANIAILKRARHDFYESSFRLSTYELLHHHPNVRHVRKSRVTQSLPFSISSALCLSGKLNVLQH